METALCRDGVALVVSRVSNWKRSPQSRTTGIQPGGSSLGADPLFGVDNSRVTTHWSSDLVNQPEEQSIGVQFAFYPVNTDLVVSNAKRFIFEGTGLGDGDTLPGLLGYEADRGFGGGPADLIQLCYSPVSGTTEPQTHIEESNTNTSAGFSEMTIYTARSGALVFATGSIQFNWGLDNGANSSLAHLVNPAAQRMVRNLFRRFN